MRKHADSRVAPSKTACSRMAALNDDVLVTHRGFDLVRRIGDTRGQEVGAHLGYQKHVFQVVPLSSNRSDRLKRNSFARAQWA